jgi:LemA protein
MNKTTNVLITLGIIGIMLFCIVGGMYNGLVGSANDVRNKWSDVQSNYQRRADVVKQNLPVLTAGAAQEIAVFTILRDQAAALSGSFKYDQFNQPIIPTGAEAQQVAQQIESFDKALVNVMVYAADNPEIQSTQLFADFMVLIEGSENRINIARRDYNKAVTTYRNRTQMFPTNMLAGMFGFDANAFPYFQAEEGTQNAPVITFPTPSTQ